METTVISKSTELVRWARSRKQVIPRWVELVLIEVNHTLQSQAIASKISLSPWGKSWSISNNREIVFNGGAFSQAIQELLDLPRLRINIQFRGMWRPQALISWHSHVHWRPQLVSLLKNRLYRKYLLDLDDHRFQQRVKLPIWKSSKLRIMESKISKLNLVVKLLSKITKTQISKGLSNK